MQTLIWFVFAINTLVNAFGSTENALSSSFVYKIASKRRSKAFINAKNGDRFTSKVMQTNHLDFQLHFYPNGRFEHQENQFLVYLCINDLSQESKISAVFIDWTFVIHEISFSYIVKSRHHSDNAQCRGFTVYDTTQIIQPLKELLANKQSPLKKISFGVTIAIKNRFYAQSIINNEIPIQINRHNKFVWTINEKHILDELLLAQHQQTYVSNLYEDLFFLSITPNGYHESTHNSFDMFLNLVYLPKEISKLKLRCIFTISELKIIHHFDAEWTNIDKGWGWPSRKFPIDILKLYASSSNVDKLTIISECETEIIFDENGNAMEMNKNWKYFKVAAQNTKMGNGVESKYAPKVFEANSNDEYCLEPGNISNTFHFENLNRVLFDISQDVDVVKQQLFITIGIFTMNFGVTIFMFSVLISLLCCGCF
eukprot:390157_1